MAFDPLLYKEEDLEKLLPLCMKWKDSCGSSCSLESITKEKALGVLKSCLDHGFIIVVEQEGVPIAFSILLEMQKFWMGDKMIKQEFWFVDPEYRSQGIGAFLAKANEKICREKGFDFMYINLTDEGGDLDSAKSLSEKMGFEEVGYIFRKSLKGE